MFSSNSNKGQPVPGLSTVKEEETRPESKNTLAPVIKEEDENDPFSTEQSICNDIEAEEEKTNDKASKLAPLKALWGLATIAK